MAVILSRNLHAIMSTTQSEAEVREDHEEEHGIISFGLEDFKLWSVHTLKKFLSLRKKPTEGSFEELVSW